MTYITLDSIVKSYLLRREYPMHYYLTGLKHAADCVRELRRHSLPVIKTFVGNINEYGAIDLPEDFSSVIRVGWMNGQHIVPLVQAKGFNRALNVDSNGQPIPHGAPNHRDWYGGNWLIGWFNNWNMWGENPGGWYGYGAGYETDLYMIIEERCQMQFSEELIGLTIVMDYIPDINSCDHLTRIPAYAQACIEQYIVWQLKEHNRNYSKSEAKDEERMYGKQLRLLRSQVYSLGGEDILRAFRRGYHSGIKS